MNSPGARIDDFRRRLQDLGAGPAHVPGLLRAWLYARPLGSGKREPEHFLPAAVRQDLPALSETLHALARVRSAHTAQDGSVRLLVDLCDGQTVETVMLPRDGVCVSTQVGCAVGCRFCMTGQNGLLRQLGSAEIVAQVVLARRQRAVRKVVFMGMGEPSHNLDNVLESMEVLGQEGGIGHKNLVFSTVGDLRVFERLPQGRVKPALALSLHTTRDELRASLLPRAPRIPVAELVRLGDDYARATGYPLQVQWTLLAGVNDSDEEMAAAAALLKGRHAMLNLIPYNEVEGPGWRRPDMARTVALTRALNRQGVLTRIRYSAGQDVDAGCGQLRARSAQADSKGAQMIPIEGPHTLRARNLPHS